MEAIKIEVCNHRDGGFEYRVFVRGETLSGWRGGTRDEVEAHARKIARGVNKRTEGLKYYNGRQR